MLGKYTQLFLLFLFVLAVNASAAVTTGVWFNYKYQTDPSDNPDRETWGSLGDEAVILYLDHQEQDSPWLFSAEFRMGPGSFTDVDNNSSGDNYLLHKAWLAYQFENESLLKIGKSQVPFGWKTTNFWPGDMLLGGYGDQMDVGINYSANAFDTLSWSLAYFQADDWGATSTDTADDNRHWGSSTTYRKVQTIVADINWQLTEKHKLGSSAQLGLLQDLNEAAGANPDFQEVTGKHQGLAFYYSANFTERFSLKAQLDWLQRDLPNSLRLKKIENARAALSAIYQLDQWQFYLDATAAKSFTQGNTTGITYALAPGAKYDYGNGWFYIEYLQQDGDIDRNGDVAEGDFAALYLTLDYYFSL